MAGKEGRCTCPLLMLVTFITIQVFSPAPPPSLIPPSLPPCSIFLLSQFVVVVSLFVVVSLVCCLLFHCCVGCHCCVYSYRSPDKTVKYFTYHPKRRRSKPDNSSYLQDWKETASHIPQGQYSEAAPKHLNINSSNKDIREWSSSKQREFSAHSVGGDGGDGGVVKGDAVEDVDRGDVSTRGRQGGGGGGGKEWNQSGCDDEAFSTGGSSSSSSSYLRKSSGGMTQTYDSGSDRASHHQQSAFSSTDGYKRAAIHTTTTGSSEDILAKSSLTQSYSHAARSVVHHHLSHSYDEGDTSNSNTSPPIGVLTRRQKVAGHMEGVRRNSSYHESSDPNSPPSTTVFNSAVLFGASLGFFEPNSALMRSPGESPKSSRDRLNSLTDLSAEV